MRLYGEKFEIAGEPIFIRDDEVLGDAIEWRIALRALDDDSRVSVLLNPSGTKDAFECPGIPARRWTVVSSPSLLSRPWWNLPQNFVVVAVVKWKAFCAFQPQRLFHRHHHAAAACSGWC